MYDFMNAIGGMGFAILGAALTVGLCCVGSAKGTGLGGEAAAGLVSEDPDKSTKCLILQVLPGTQGLYGFVALFIVLLQVGLMSGTPVDLTLTQGMSFFAACIVMKMSLRGAGDTRRVMLISYGIMGFFRVVCTWVWFWLAPETMTLWGSWLVFAFEMAV